MNYRSAAVLATVSNSFCDAILDYVVNKYNYYKVLLFTSSVAFMLQFGWGIYFGINMPLSSLPYVFIHGLVILVGYICFVKSLEFLPLGLVGLLETGNLFLTLVVDSLVGYVTITPYFLLMFCLFIFSIFLFCRDCLSTGSGGLKHISGQGFVWIFCSVVLYAVAPYIVKMSDVYGANEIAISLGYYILAVPYFAFCYFRSPENEKTRSAPAQKWWNSLFVLVLLIGILESVYFVAETFSFMNDAPTVVMIIEQMRIFLIFILSILFGMDTFTLRKAIALILGVVSVIGVYYS